MNSKHSYSAFHRFSRIPLYILAVVCFAMGLLLLGNLIISLEQDKVVSIQNSIISFLILSVFLPLFHLYVDFLEVDLHVDESGVNLKSPIKTFHVNWEDIIEVRRASLSGIPMFNKPNIVITKSKLTPFHYLYRLIYGRTLRPSFYFSAFISDSDKLRQTIREGVKKNKPANQIKNPLENL